MPKLTGAAISPSFEDLKASVPNLPPAYQLAADFDWAMHPGGASILSGAERALGITPQHMRASYDTYVNHGNSSSASIYRVMHRLRSKEMDSLAPDGRVRDYIVGCAFGPGITVESCLLKRGRCGSTDIPTPPEVDEPVATSTRDEDALFGTSSAMPVMNDSVPDETERFIADQLKQIDLD